MLDGVALIASVITIATVIIEGVKHAKTFYRAFEGFSALLASKYPESAMSSLFLSRSPVVLR
jgi:hypothetical protein